VAGPFAGSAFFIIFTGDEPSRQNMVIRVPAVLSSVIYLSVVLIFMNSCTSSKKISSPLKEAMTDSLPSLPASEINLPVKIYAPPLLAKAESMAPKEITSDKWPDYVQNTCDFRYKYRFVRSGLSISCLNSKITIQFSGNYQVVGSKTICSMNTPISPWISGSCGFGREPMRRVNIGLSSQLNFLPTYQLRSLTQVTQLQPLDKCQVSLFSSNITDLIVDSIRSSTGSFCNVLDQTIAKLNMSGILQESQKSLDQTSLGKFGWLRIHPDAIRIGPLNYSRDSFRVIFGMTCRPELSSENPKRADAPLLPPLAQTEKHSGVFLYLNAVYDYKYLSKIISDTLRNKVFDINGRTIVIKEVECKGTANHQIEIRISFAGSNEGSIFLKGTPLLDTAKQTLTVPDISYSLESSDLVLRIAQTLFRNKIRKTIQGKSFLDLGALVKSNLPTLDSILNRELASPIYLAGKVLEIKLIGLLAGPDEIHLQLYLHCDLELQSNGIF
jgi:hypothetical protein